MYSLLSDELSIKGSLMFSRVSEDVVVGWLVGVLSLVSFLSLEITIKGFIVLSRPMLIT